MKQLKDYLRFYIGCYVMVTPPESASYKYSLTGVMSKRTDGEDKLRIQVFEADGEDGYEGHGIKWFDEDEIELILRPLSDMTNEESLCWQKFGGSWAVTNQKRRILSMQA